MYAQLARIMSVFFVCCSIVQSSEQIEIENTSPSRKVEDKRTYLRDVRRKQIIAENDQTLVAINKSENILSHSTLHKNVWLSQDANEKKRILQADFYETAPSDWNSEDWGMFALFIVIAFIALTCCCRMILPLVWGGIACLRDIVFALFCIEICCDTSPIDQTPYGVLC